MNKNNLYQNTLRFLLISLVALSSSLTPASAQTNELDLGLRIGLGRSNIKTGISARHFLGEDIALEGILSLSGAGGLALFGQRYFPLEDGLRFFAGAGAYLGFNSQHWLGISGMAGLEYQFEQYPLSVSLDWKPELNLLNEVRLHGIPLGITARYRINW